MVRWMDGRIDGQMDRRTAGWMDGWTDGRTDGQTDGQMDERTDKQTDGRMDRMENLPILQDLSLIRAVPLLPLKKTKRISLKVCVHRFYKAEGLKANWPVTGEVGLRWAKTG